MFRGCLFRQAILALSFVVFLGGSLAFHVIGLSSTFVRRSDSAISTGLRHYDRHIVGPETSAGTHLPAGVRLTQKRTSLVGLSSKNSVENGRNTGLLKEEDDQRRGGGLNIIRLGRRNRIQLRRENKSDVEKDIHDDESLPSACGTETIILTETQPNRGRWRPLRVLRPRLRNEDDAQNQQEQPIASSDGRNNGRNKNRRGNRRGSDVQQRNRKGNIIEEQFGDSDETFSVGSETPSTPEPLSSISEEFMSIVPAANITEDSSMKNIDKDPTDTISKRDLDEEEQADDELPNDKKEKRVSWSATAKSTRILKLDSEGRAFLNKYMTQPVEQYSVITFYGDADNDEDGSGSGDDGQISGRRWLIRRLTDKESAPYRSKERGIPNFRKRRKAKESEEESPPGVHGSNSANFFRLAVPLMPLIGLDLTPVIDVEVIPPASALASLEKNLKSDDKEASEHDDSVDQEGADSDDNRRVGIMGRLSDDHDVVRIQSLRVSLLSTEEEVSEIMREKSTGPFRRQRNMKNQVAKPSATAVSKNENVRKMGYEAIHMVDKLAELTHPHLYFESEITWNEGKNKKRNRKNHDCTVTVKSTVATSVTIPPLPIAFPLPTGLFVSKIGSTITKRVLKLVLPRFLRLLESDFKRWASIDTNDEPSDR